jgi:hypothetical protein
MNVTRTSILTGTTQTLYIEGLTQDMLDRYHDGELIQNALASIPIELREFVMTGISPAEWKEKLPEDDDDYSGECMMASEEKRLTEEQLWDLGHGALLLGTQYNLDEEN